MAEPHIESPEYSGVERRKMLVLQHCNCHPKHEKVLNDHTEMLKEMRLDTKDREERRTQEHGIIEGDLKGRVEKKIFYLFIAITISILGFVYNGIHQVDKAVAVLTNNIAIETRNLTEYSKELKQSVKDVEIKVERHIQQTRHVSGNPNGGM